MQNISFHWLVFTDKTSFIEVAICITVKMHYSNHEKVNVRDCSPEHFTLAHLPRPAAYIRWRFSSFLCVRSFRALVHSALASLLSALLRYACAPRLFWRLSLPLSSLSLSALLVPRAILSSRLDRSSSQ